MREHEADWGETQDRLPRRGLSLAAAAVALLLLGLAIPESMADGVEHLPEGRRAAGEFVLTHGALGCLDNPIQRAAVRAVRITWLHPTWQPSEEPQRGYRPLVVARLTGHTLFGVPAQRITVFAGGGASCWDVDVEREYSLLNAVEHTRRAANARWLVRLPDDVFPPTGVVGRIDFARMRSVVDRPPPPELADLPYYDAAAIFEAMRREAPGWTYRGETEEGARFVGPSAAAAAAMNRPWVPTAVVVDRGGHVRAIEYVIPSAATLRPAVLYLFDLREAEPLDHPAALPY